MTDKRTAPVLIDLDTPGPSPAEAPPVEDAPKGEAMTTIAALATRRPSRLARWFWGTLGAVLTFALSVVAWDFVTGLIERNPVLGAVGLGLLGIFVVICLVILIREWAALARLSRLDALQHAAAEADTMEKARDVVDRLLKLYRNRPDMDWPRSRFAERRGDVFDAEALAALAETELLAPLDRMATKEVEAAARQVATVTALVPLALADVVAALTANLRMIRRIAAIYGGRGGTLGSWRLTRAVFAHLVATGAVAVGDDMLGSVAGGGVLSKLSRRFGEGLINGALTARVGVAAIEVCRPLPFRAKRKPAVSALVSRAVTGLFDKKDA
ncbi:MAG: TIGR01620 family protein [Paracoccaceae bacterium]|nr:TIGR01620 family protein [Paracoccaceae bacterium]